MTTNRIPVDELSFGVLDMQPIDTDWDGEALMNDEWRFWQAADERDVEGRGITFIVSNFSIVGAFLSDGRRIPYTYEVNVDEMECENCSGLGMVTVDRPGTEETDDADCPECAGTGNTLKLTEQQITAIDNTDAGELYCEGPMMNYRYPTGDNHDNVGGWHHAGDAVEIAYRLRNLPVIVTEYNDTIALALTGGGMDLSWEIVEAFTLLGYLPPVHFELPGMAGRGRDSKYSGEKDAYLIAAVDRSLSEMVERAQRNLGYHREKWGGAA